VRTSGANHLEVVGKLACKAEDSKLTLTSG
jgi:hypothetical protein